MQDSKILVKRDPPEHELAGKIVIAPGDMRFEDSYVCTVLAHGPGKTLLDGSIEPTGVSIGERVVVLHGHGVPLDDLLIIDAEMVEATVEE